MIDQDIRRFRPDLRPGLAYAAYGLTNMATDGQSTVLLDVDGDRDSRLVALDQTGDHGQSLLFVMAICKRPTVGATNGPCLTTNVFRAEPFALL